MFICINCSRIKMTSKKHDFEKYSKNKDIEPIKPIVKLNRTIMEQYSDIL